MALENGDHQYSGGSRDQDATIDDTSPAPGRGKLGLVAPPNRARVAGGVCPNWGIDPARVAGASAVGAVARLLARPACVVLGKALRWRPAADVDASRPTAGGRLGNWIRRRTRGSEVTWNTLRPHCAPTLAPGGLAPETGRRQWRASIGPGWHIFPRGGRSSSLSLDSRGLWLGAGQAGRCSRSEPVGLPEAQHTCFHASEDVVTCMCAQT